MARPTRRKRVLISFTALIAVLGLISAAAQAWLPRPVDIKDCTPTTTLYPGSDLPCTVKIYNEGEVDALGANDMYVLRVDDMPDNGLAWISGTPLELYGPNPVRIAPKDTPDNMLVHGAVKELTLKYLFRVNPKASPGEICNRVDVTTIITNYKAKPDVTSAKDCVTVVAPPPPAPPVVVPPVVPPIVVPPPAPPVVVPPVVKQPSVATPKPKPKPCKTKKVLVVLSSNVMNDDPAGHYRSRSVGNSKRCHYANPHKHLRLRHSPNRAPRNPNGKISFWVTGNGQFVDIVNVKYKVQGHSRGSLFWRAPYRITFFSRNFAAPGERLNEVKTTTATIKVRLKPLTKYPS